MNNTKILVVEDDESLRNLLIDALGIAGFDVVAYPSGESVSNKISSIKPDLIVSDIMMPGITGLELIEKVHQQAQFKQIPFIFLSALASKEDQNKGIIAGAKGYITKPFKASELLALIRELLG